tara:strand:- start:88 stop:345 length:258 start_codon:yes stop_codon:yes gene_type:complete
MMKQIPRNLFFWSAMVWAAANLFAQAVYIGFYGVPFDGIAMIDSLGNWYYVLLTIEVGVWMYVAMFFGKRLFARINSSTHVQINH